MDLTLPPGSGAELPAGLLQAVVVAALAVLFWVTYYRTARLYLRWWGVTWTCTPCAWVLSSHSS